MNLMFVEKNIFLNIYKIIFYYFSKTFTQNLSDNFLLFIKKIC